MSEQILYGTAEYNLIYIFAIHDDAHDGYLKIGEHSFTSPSSFKQLPPNCDELNQNAHARIKQYTKTALVQYELLYTELARTQVQLADGTIENSTFSDSNVHEVLSRSGFDCHKFYDTGKDSEWYKVDLNTAIAAIQAVKAGRNTLTAAEIAGNTQETIPGMADTPAPVLKPQIKLRDEQRACVSKTQRVFANGDRMLWDCKMRFGKTITAYALVKKMDYQKVLVVTHRPAVVDGWRKDFALMFDDNRQFITKSNIKQEDRFTAEDASIDAANDRHLENLAATGQPFVYFSSMQDLRGSKLVGGKFDKNRSVFSMDWDLIIYDEAHEGTQTDLGENVQKLLEKPKAGKNPKKVLQLSGTPYNLLNQYDPETTYSWDYVMEQKAKREWDEKHPGDHNPYADLPEMRICTFDLRDKIATSYRYEDESIAFNFHEFFRTWTGDPDRDFNPIPAGASVGDFVHQDDVWEFLNLISMDSDNSNYPFSTQDYRDMFRHTFWILPGVKEARAFSALLKVHPVFKEYEVVNVAGEGDKEQPYDDALRAVHDAISHHPCTITLSCGKLTTGVTVKEWTGVMLLSGSANTAAAGYMQTIFRAQSAGSINGKRKRVCYAFDFAPDRTLKVLSEVHQLKKASVQSDDTSRDRLAEFLNFCPVLAEGETGMEFYDVPKMMRQLKRLTVEAAVKSGFDDDSIYRADAGIVVDKEQLKIIDLLNRKLSPQKKAKKGKDVPINEQGLTDEQYKKAQSAKHKKKKDRTPEEEEALKKERELKKKQQGLFDLLRNISIRLPLLIYGTATEFDESIKLKEFVSIVDTESWNEFMPKEVDKEFFLKLLTFYDEDVIEEAGMRIRRLARAADDMMPTQRVIRLAEVFSCFRNPAKETVLTPWRVVNMHMGDTIGGYNFYKEGYPMNDGELEEPRFIEHQDVTANLFLNENVKILEMNSKSGLYPLYVAYSIYRMLLPKKESQLTLEEAQAVWYQALDEHLFVLCQTQMAVSITKRTLAGYTKHPVNAIHLPKLIERMQDPKRLSHKLLNPKTWNQEGEPMKFDAIVGNPPYQQSDGGNNASAIPIYNKFIEQAIALSPHYISMITPSRWYSGGRGLDMFRKMMINDVHLKSLHDFANSSECFPGVDISGGICYFLRDEYYNGPCRITNEDGLARSAVERYLNAYPVLVRNNSAVSILDKIRATHIDSISNYVSSQKPFGLRTFARPNDTGDLVLRWNGGKGPLKREDVSTGFEMIDKWKVIVSRVFYEHGGKVNKEGQARVLSILELLRPNEVCTETYIVVNSFIDETEAKNFYYYLQTKFVRFLILQASSSIMIAKSSFLFAPMQDFSQRWTDSMLYAKYGLTESEIAIIEQSIKPMLLSCDE